MKALRDLFVGMLIFSLFYLPNQAGAYEDNPLAREQNLPPGGLEKFIVNHTLKYHILNPPMVEGGSYRDSTFYQEYIHPDSTTVFGVFSEGGRLIGNTRVGKWRIMSSKGKEFLCLSAADRKEFCAYIVNRGRKDSIDTIDFIYEDPFHKGAWLKDKGWIWEIKPSALVEKSPEEILMKQLTDVYQFYVEADECRKANISFSNEQMNTLTQLVKLVQAKIAPSDTQINAAWEVASQQGKNLFSLMSLEGPRKQYEYCEVLQMRARQFEGAGDNPFK